MRIGIITFHTALNYGAVLQTYGLYKSLVKMGVEAKVIDYRAPFNEERFSPPKVSFFFNLRVLYSIIFRNSFQRYSPEGFKSFITKNLELTSPIYKYEDLSELNSEFDEFITGSDQVWNLACTSGDDAYFLPFVNDNNKKNSYAASIGYTILPTDKKALYAKLLAGFNHISVRETSGVDIVSSLIGKKAELVLDPTLLLNKKEWTAIADFSLVPKKKYILMYLMSEDRDLIHMAKKYAKQHDLEILYLTQRLFNVFGVKSIRDVTPEQWLGLFLCSESIVTNSFHGLVFSINFGKHFITKYIPRSIVNSRLKTMIESFDLHAWLMDSVEFDTEKTIDMDSVQYKLEQERLKSLNFIKQIVNK